MLRRLTLVAAQFENVVARNLESVVMPKCLSLRPGCCLLLKGKSVVPTILCLAELVRFNEDRLLSVSPYNFAIVYT